VLAVEPVMSTWKMLVSNLVRNDIYTVLPLCAAVGGKTEWRDFYVLTSHPGGSGFYHDRHAELAERRSVAVTTLQWIREQCPGVPAVIKLDCEGAEREILTEEALAVPPLSTAVSILVEWHNYDGATYLKRLRDAGFDCTLHGAIEGSGGVIRARRP
jgi:FkbM family methyltransferase